MHSKPAILLVDDEPVVIRVCERILAASGFAVLTAENGGNGLDLYDLNRDQIVLVVADASMPFMGGVEFARRLLEINAAVKIMIITGHGTDHAFPDDLRASCIFLTKPFSATEFRSAVTMAVSSDSNAEPTSL